MLSLLRKAERERAKIARASLASALLLVLLSGVLPFSALASRGCKMACCVSKLSHGAESCSLSFAGENQEEASDTQSKEDSAAHHHMQQEGAHRSSNEESQTASISYEALTSTCSPECACAPSASTQSPRPRETAALSDAARPRPPTLVIFSESSSKVLLPSAYLRRRSRPRAPPSSLINTTA